uniref:STIL N-terminal domain-containing protein n=1 Tax=Neogobius melanostomus TaxID=47308 RepID=A0A8C6WUF6_9GOBI
MCLVQVGVKRLKVYHNLEKQRVMPMANSLTTLTFPKSRCALWDGAATGEKLLLHLCAHRPPHVQLLEKALRLAQRHVRHSSRNLLHCFFLGSVSVDSDEEGVTLTLDRFDPGRDQNGVRVPTGVLPGDVCAPCVFTSDPSASVSQSEAELLQAFRALTGRLALDLSQLLRLRLHVFCTQSLDTADFALSWSCMSPATSVHVEPVRAVNVIPTALLRSLTSPARPTASSRQRGNLVTMDQTRKLLLLLESDPKALSLPLVGVWFSGAAQVHSPHIWAWTLRFLHSSSIQDRVFSESGCFLLVLFSSTHRTPQFYQCKVNGAGRELPYQLLTGSHRTKLYQHVASVEGQTLKCDLSSETDSRETDVFVTASAAVAPAATLSVTDQDSGVEDEDLSPRPSPILNPFVPDSNNPTVRPRTVLVDRLHPQQRAASSPSYRTPIPSAYNHPALQNFHPPSSNPAHNHNFTSEQAANVHQSHFKMPQTAQNPTLNLFQTPPSVGKVHHATVGTNDSYPPANNSQTHYTNSNFRTTDQASAVPPFASRSVTVMAPPPPPPPMACAGRCCEQQGALSSGEAYHLLLQQDRQLQLLQQQVSDKEAQQEVTESEQEEELRRRTLDRCPSPAHSSLSGRIPGPDTGSKKKKKPQEPSAEDVVLSATLRRLQQLGVTLDKRELSDSDRAKNRAVENASTLACINPAAVVSRLSAADSSLSLLPHSSADLSLEANAIALRYLSDRQLTRLSLSGHVPTKETKPESSALSPSNMSLATRKYMRKYGLIEEESEEEEEEPKLLPQSQLIRELKPKMKLLTGNSEDKENNMAAARRREVTENQGSVGNILDLSRLRQLPKLF